MNIYDTKVIRCVKCDKCIGEIDYDAYVIRPICGQCYDPKPDVRDQLSYRTKFQPKKAGTTNIRIMPKMVRKRSSS